MKESTRKIIRDNVDAVLAHYLPELSCKKGRKFKIGKMGSVITTREYAEWLRDFLLIHDNVDNVVNAIHEVLRNHGHQLFTTLPQQSTKSFDIEVEGQPLIVELTTADPNTTLKIHTVKTTHQTLLEA